MNYHKNIISADHRYRTFSFRKQCFRPAGNEQKSEIPVRNFRSFVACYGFFTNYSDDDDSDIDDELDDDDFDDDIDDDTDKEDGEDTPIPKEKEADDSNGKKKGKR